MAQDTYASPSIQASSSTFATLQGGGFAAIIAAVIAANPAIATPTTAPTVSATGGGSSGGSLPAGTYFVSYTWTDGAGETASKEIASSFTIAATNIPRVTIPALPTGANGANIYLTVAGGASGTEVLYATGVTATTFDMSFAGPADTLAAAAPAANTTGAATIAPKINKGFQDQLTLEWHRLSDLISQYVSGKPVDYQATRLSLIRIDYAFLVYHQALKESLTLIAGQAQSLHNVSGLVMPYVQRRFP